MQKNTKKKKKVKGTGGHAIVCCCASTFLKYKAFWVPFEAWRKGEKDLEAPLDICGFWHRMAVLVVRAQHPRGREGGGGGFGLLKFVSFLLSKQDKTGWPSCGIHPSSQPDRYNSSTGPREFVPYR